MRELFAVHSESHERRFLAVVCRALGQDPPGHVFAGGGPVRGMFPALGPQQTGQEAQVASWAVDQPAVVGVPALPGHGFREGVREAAEEVRACVQVITSCRIISLNLY